MKYSLVVLAFIISLVACSKPAFAPEIPTSYNPYSYLIERTVVISAECPKGGGWGSGVLLGGNRVLTARHVADASDCDYTVIHQGTEYPVVDVILDPNADLAVLVVPQNFSVGETRIAESVFVGQPIICVGFPSLPGTNERLLSVTTGDLATVHEDFYRVTAHIRYGSSGSACWTESGEVVGIASYLIVDKAGGEQPGLWFLVPAPKIIEFLAGES